MSLPPVDPDKSVAGIALDPHTLERVIPESRRPDGSTRKQIKIRPGFTPQEDVRRFRGTRQTQMDANVLPKGHIIGWLAPSTPSPTSSNIKSLSKSAKKNAKRKEKRQMKDGDVRDNWEEDDDDEGVAEGVNSGGNSAKMTEAGAANSERPDHASNRPNSAATPGPEPTVKAVSTPTTDSDATTPALATKSDNGADTLTSKLEQLKVQ